MITIVLYVSTERCLEVVCRFVSHSYREKQEELKAERQERREKRQEKENGSEGADSNATANTTVATEDEEEEADLVSYHLTELSSKLIL